MKSISNLFVILVHLKRMFSYAVPDSERKLLAARLCGPRFFTVRAATQPEIIARTEVQLGQKEDLILQIQSRGDLQKHSNYLTIQRDINEHITPGSRSIPASTPTRLQPQPVLSISPATWKLLHRKILSPTMNSLSILQPNWIWHNRSSVSAAAKICLQNIHGARHIAEKF